jgi:hypothetical protein
LASRKAKACADTTFWVFAHPAGVALIDGVLSDLGGTAPTRTRNCLRYVLFWTCNSQTIANELDTSVSPEFAETMQVVVRHVLRAPEAAWPFGMPVDESLADAAATVSLVRYHEWAERGASTMRVWVPTLASWAARKAE